MTVPLVSVPIENDQKSRERVTLARITMFTCAVHAQFYVATRST